MLLKVVVLTDMDYAGSGYFQAEALKSVVGAENVAHVAFRKHPWGFPYEFILKNPDGTMDGIEFCTVKRLIDEATLVHIWNIEPDWKQFDQLEISKGKMRSATYSGSLYRLEHTRLNKKLNDMGFSIVVENPSYRYLDEIDSTFIPHAVPIEQLDTIETGTFREGDISVYSRGPGKRKTTTREEDIEYLESLIKTRPDWSIVQKGLVSWWTRMVRLPKSQFCFEYLENTVQWFGRSALEACCFGIPTISWYSDRALELAEGKVGSPAIMRANRSTLEKMLNSMMWLLEDREGWDQYCKMAWEAAAWIRKYFSYKTVGGQYRDFFLGVLSK